jgi:hypothetical protein
MADRRNDLRAALRQSRVGSATQLRAALGVSQPTLSRLLGRLGDAVVRFGRGPRTRYAIARTVRGFPSAIPLFRIRPDGAGERAGVVRALDPEGFALLDAPDDFWPLPGDMADGCFEALPYFLFDARPQGFLGRALARRRAAELNVSSDPTTWGDDDVLVVLLLAGEDLPGDLVLGEPAYERLAARMLRPKPAIPDTELEDAYPRLAEEALADGVPASSAGGEFPKFTAGRNTADGHREVLVKFSGAGDTSAVRRWSDLLVAESVAAASMTEDLGDAAPCRILQFGGRTFLEVDRFDRVGPWGRRPACTLSAIEAALLGLGDARWDRAAKSLAERGLVGAAARDQIVARWCFGNLIANGDMHAANLAFHPTGPALALTPAYDMLPMQYAPAPGGDVPAPAFNPPLPLPGHERHWLIAASAAVRFWEACGDNELISSGFRDVCRRNAERVALLRARVGG